MNKNLLIAIVLSGAIITGGYFFIAQNRSNMQPVDTDFTDETEESGQTLDDSQTPKSKAKIRNYTKSEYERDKISGKLVVLYFYANWCPICKEELPIYKSAIPEFDSSEVIGYIVNFNDSETTADEKNLAREHGVAYQHTKVFVKNGVRAYKAPDVWSKSRYLTEINKYK